MGTLAAVLAGKKIFTRKDRYGAEAEGHAENVAGILTTHDDTGHLSPEGSERTGWGRLGGVLVISAPLSSCPERDRLYRDRGPTGDGGNGMIPGAAILQGMAIQVISYA
jgi:hypothetical protein